MCDPQTSANSADFWLGRGGFADPGELCQADAAYDIRSEIVPSGFVNPVCIMV
jgi:hypothetical protein